MAGLHLMHKLDPLRELRSRSTKGTWYVYLCFWIAMSASRPPPSLAGPPRVRPGGTGGAEPLPTPPPGQDRWRRGRHRPDPSPPPGAPRQKRTSVDHPTNHHDTTPSQRNLSLPPHRQCAPHPSAARHDRLPSRERATAPPFLSPFALHAHCSAQLLATHI